MWAGVGLGGGERYRMSHSGRDVCGSGHSCTGPGALGKNARRRARLPRTEHARYERLGRDLGAARDELAQAEASRQVAEVRIAELGEQAVRLKAQEEALRAGPEMRSARELEQAADDARRTEAELRRAEADREQATQDHTRALGRLADASARLGKAEDQLAGTLEQEREAARAARLTGGLRTDGAPEAELRRAAGEAVDRRRRTVDHVADLVAQAEQAAAEAATAAAGNALVAAVRDHLRGCAELAVDDPEGLLDVLTDWTTHLTGPSPARERAAQAHRVRAARLADESAALGRRLADLGARREAAERELAGLEAGGQVGPPAPHTRTPGVREEALGAPLWRLTDFREHVGTAERAGLEAALEASGLLDARVCPDGTALATDGHDVLLAPGAPLTGRPRLDGALRPAVDHGDARAAAVGEAAVVRLLGAIGLGDGPGDGTGTGHGDTWVAPDGRFRVGALTGSWAKEAAVYVGEGSARGGPPDPCRRAAR